MLPRIITYKLLKATHPMPPFLPLSAEHKGLPYDIEGLVESSNLWARSYQQRKHCSNSYLVCNLGEIIYLTYA